MLSMLNPNAPGLGPSTGTTIIGGSPGLGPADYGPPDVGLIGPTTPVMTYTPGIGSGVSGPPVQPMGGPPAPGMLLPFGLMAAGGLLLVLGLVER
jgi:hypothetical protein